MSLSTFTQNETLNSAWFYLPQILKTKCGYNANFDV